MDSPSEREAMRALLEEAGRAIESSRDELKGNLARARGLAITARTAGWTIEAISGALRVTRQSVAKWIEDDARS